MANYQNEQAQYESLQQLYDSLQQQQQVSGQTFDQQHDQNSLYELHQNNDHAYSSQRQEGALNSSIGNSAPFTEAGVADSGNAAPAAQNPPKHPPFHEMWPEASFSWASFACATGLAREQAKQLQWPVTDGNVYLFWIPSQQDFNSWHASDRKIFVQDLATLGVYLPWWNLDQYFTQAPLQQIAQNQATVNVESVPTQCNTSGTTESPEFTFGGTNSASGLDLEIPLGGSDLWNATEVEDHGDAAIAHARSETSSLSSLSQLSQSVSTPEQSSDAQSTHVQEAADEIDAAIRAVIEDDDEDDDNTYQDGDAVTGASSQAVAQDDEDAQDDSVPADEQTADDGPLQPSSATDHVTLTFSSDQGLLAFKNRLRAPQHVDPTIPTTNAGKLACVLRLKKAMMDIEFANDKRGASFDKRWLKAPTELYYDERAFEVIAHEIYDRTLELTQFGPGIFRCYDKDHIKKYEASFKAYTFEERIDMIVELLLKSKDRVNSLMKHQGLDDVIGFPEKLNVSSARNHGFNAKRAISLATGKATFEADPNTSASEIVSEVRRKWDAKLKATTSGAQTEVDTTADAEESAPANDTGDHQDGVIGSVTAVDDSYTAPKTRSSTRGKRKCAATQQAPASTPSGPQAAANPGHGMHPSSLAQPAVAPPSSGASKAPRRKRQRPAAVESAAQPSSAPKRRRLAATKTQPSVKPTPTPAVDQPSPQDNDDLYEAPSSSTLAAARASTQAAAEQQPSSDETGDPQATPASDITELLVPEPAASATTAPFTATPATVYSEPATPEPTATLSRRGRKRAAKDETETQPAPKRTRTRRR